MAGSLGNGKKGGGSLASAMLAAMKSSEEETNNVGGISQSQSSPSIMELANGLVESTKISKSPSSNLMNETPVDNEKMNGSSGVVVNGDDTTENSIFADDEDVSDQLKKRAERRRRMRYEEEEESFDLFAPKSDENNNITENSNNESSKHKKSEDETNEEEEVTVEEKVDVAVGEQNEDMICAVLSKNNVSDDDNVAEVEEVENAVEIVVDTVSDHEDEMVESPNPNDDKATKETSEEIDDESDEEVDDEKEISSAVALSEKVIKPLEEEEEKEVSEDEEIKNVEKDEEDNESEESKTVEIDSNIEEKSNVELENVDSQNESNSQNIEIEKEAIVVESKSKIENKIEEIGVSTKQQVSVPKQSEEETSRDEKLPTQKENKKMIETPDVKKMIETPDVEKVDDNAEDIPEKRKSKSPPPPVTKKPSKQPKEEIVKDAGISEEKVTSPKGSRNLGSKISGLLNKVGSPKSAPKVFKKTLSPRTSADKKAMFEQTEKKSQPLKEPKPLSKRFSIKKESPADETPKEATSPISQKGSSRFSSPALSQKRSLRKSADSPKVTAPPATMKKPVSPRKEKPAPETTSTDTKGESPSSTAPPATMKKPMSPRKEKPAPETTSTDTKEKLSSTTEPSTKSDAQNKETGSNEPKSLSKPSPTKDESTSPPSKTRSSVRDRVSSHSNNAKTNMTVSGKDKKGLFMKWENRATPEQRRKNYATPQVSSPSPLIRNKSLLAAKRASFNKEASQERSTDSDNSNPDYSGNPLTASPVLNRFQRNSSMRTSLNENNLATTRKRLVTNPHSIATPRNSVKNRMAIFAKFEKQ